MSPSTLLNGFNNATDSFDRIIRLGYPLTISVFTWTLASNFYLIAISITLARIFDIIRAAAFCLLANQNQDWDVDQFRVTIRNLPQALDVVGRIPYIRPWRFLHNRRDGESVFASIVLWEFGAVLIICLTLVSPVLLTLIPLVPGKLGELTQCYGLAVATAAMTTTQSPIFLIQNQKVTESLDLADLQYDFSKNSGAAAGFRPGELVTVTQSCPAYADPGICATRLPLFVGSQFWLTPREAGLGNADNIRVGYAHTCYKARAASTAQVLVNNTFEETYRLFFGKTSPLNNYTDTASTIERRGIGYHWNAFTSLRTPDLTGLPSYLQYPPDWNTTYAPYLWQPIESIRHEGDLSLLVFHGAAPLSPSSVGPLFATSTSINNTYYDEVTKEFLYTSASLVIVVVCNTTFSVCTGNDCQQLGGSADLYDYAKTYTGFLATQGFLRTLSFESNYGSLGTVARHPASVKASQTLASNFFQSDIKSVSGRTELIRLQTSAQQWLISAVRRTVNPNAFVNNAATEGFQFYLDDSIKAMCKSTLVPANAMFVVSGTVVFSLAVALVGFLLLMYAATSLERPLWSLMGLDFLRWRAYSFPHLHRMVAEKTMGGPGEEWRGVMNEYPTGPTASSQVGVLHAAKVVGSKGVRHSTGNFAGYDKIIGDPRFEDYHKQNAPIFSREYAPSHTVNGNNDEKDGSYLTVTMVREEAEQIRLGTSTKLPRRDTFI